MGDTFLGIDYPGDVYLDSAAVPVHSALEVKISATHSLLMLSGIVLCSVKGTGSSWNRLVAHINLPIWPSAPVWVEAESVDSSARPPRYHSEGAEISVNLASISNSNVANQAGWAVDFSTWESVDQQITLLAYLAVRDSDGYIHRLNYDVRVLARTA